MKDTLKKMLPSYAYLPAIFTIVIHFATYNGTKLINGGMQHADLSISLDALIAPDPSWVLVYVFTFFLWITGLILAMREEKEICYELFGQVLVAEILCAITFVVLPTTMPRPEIAENSYCARLLNLIYSIDEPTNIFPSMHCLLSWMCFRGARSCKKVSRTFGACEGVLAVLICLSTLFVKQHVVLDVVFGIAYAEIAILLGKKLHAGNFYLKAEKLLNRGERTKEI